MNKNKPNELSSDDVNDMLRKHDFYDQARNPEGKGFSHQYKVQDIQGDKVIFDETTGLVWQQGGSPVTIEYEVAKKWIMRLKQRCYAGFNDWRLPTLEELMSLMEPDQKNGRYIDPVFDRKQSYIWTSDLVKGESWAWVVGFSSGHCYSSTLGYYGYYVRAVRSVQSSEK